MRQEFETYLKVAPPGDPDLPAIRRLLEQGG
jgi:hypothetical protein